MLRRSYTDLILSFLNESQRIILLTFLLVVAQLVFFPVYPMDDYWRHYIVSIYNFDYRPIFFDTYLPEFNLWFGYDWLISKFSIVFGYKSFILIQVLSLFFITIAFLHIARLNPLNIVPLFYFFTVSLLMSRITMARPTSLIGSMFFMTWILNNRAITYIFSLATIPLYWLFFIPSSLLCIRFPSNFICVSIGTIFWLWYSKGAYLKEIIDILQITKQTIEHKIYIAELAENFSIMPLVFFFFFPLLISLYEHKQKALRLEAKNLIGFTLVYLTNQVRFIYDYGVTFLIDMFKRFPAKYDVHKLFLMTFAVFIILRSETTNKIDYHEVINKFNQIKGANIFVACNLSHLVTNATNNRYTPAMEFNWMDERKRKIFLDITIRGEIICEDLQGSNIDYIVEKSLKNKDSKCIELFDIYKDYRIWRVKK